MSETNSMPLKDFLAWRKRLGWSQDDTAHILGVGKRTVQRWEKAAAAIPYHMIYACRYITEHQTDFEDA